MTARNPRRPTLPLNGRSQKTVLPKPEDLPGVIDALSWLQAARGRRLRGNLLILARLRGLIINRAKDWHVDYKVFLRLLRARSQHQEAPSASVIYGLGELQARATMGEAPSLTSIAKLSRRQVDRLLKETAGIACGQLPRRDNAINVGVRDALKASTLTLDLRHHARGYIHYLPHPRPYLFGLSILIESLVCFHPRTMGQWLAAGQREAINLTVLKYVGERLMLSRDVGKFHQGLLRSKHPLLQAMTAWGLAEGVSGSEPWSFAELHALAKRVGLDDSASFSLAIAGAESTCVRRRIAASKLSGDEERIRALGSNPDCATGGAQNAAAEIARLTAGLPARRERATQTGHANDELVQQLAKAWPAPGISEEQLTDLLHAFGPDAAEWSVRLAKVLGDRPGVVPLLDRVIEATSQLLGLDDPEKAFMIPFLVERKHFWLQCSSVPQALILRYANDPKGAEYRTSLLLKPLADAARQHMDVPYAVQRWRGRYESALARHACSVYLALLVALENRNDEVTANSPLARIALDQAILALQRDRSDIDPRQWVDDLTLYCVDLMQQGVLPDQRSTWRDNIRLSAFARAVAIWSDSTAVNSDPTNAKQIFMRAMTLIESGTVQRAWHRAVNLLDIAFATAARSSDDDLANQLLSLWHVAYVALRDFDQTNLGDIPRRLRDALSGPGDARDLLMTDPQWAQSHCVRVLREREPHGKR